MYSLRSLVDGAELHQQPVQPAALHLLRQLVLLDITLGLQGVELHVEAGPDHRHNLRHRAAVAVGQQVPAKSIFWGLGWLFFYLEGQIKRTG